MGDVSALDKKLEERRRREQAAAAPTAPAVPNTLADLQNEDDHRSETDAELDRALAGVGILDAYRKWCGKMEPVANGRTEGIKISCPIPGHADNDPSAWVNTDSDTWYCGGCAIGGDAYDIAAYHFGFAVPDYKQGESFVRLRREMAESLGFKVKKTPGGTKYLERAPNEPPADPAPAQQEQAQEGTPEADGSSKNSNDSDAPKLADIIEFPLPTNLQPLSIDWRSVVPEETFLHQWLELTSADDLPEEYYFWLGLVAVGMAAGDQAVLGDDPQVKANLFICLYGPSGIGKTRSTMRLVRLLRSGLPYDHEDDGSTGTRNIPMPGSPEALIDQFSKPILDPTDPKKVAGYAGVRGLIRFDELSTMVSKSQQAGNNIKPTLMQFFDSYDTIEQTTRGRGYVCAKNHFASCVVTTQPVAVRKLLAQDDTESGFVNRWVFVAGPLKPLISYRDTSIDLKSLDLPLNEIRAWSSQRFRSIELEGDCRQRWDEFFRETIEPIRVSSDRPLLTRIELIMKKLILLFCINERRDKPTVDLIDRVLSLYPYVARGYEMLSGEIGIGPQRDCANQILEIIRDIEAKTGQAATNRQINQRLGKKQAPEMIVKVLGYMVQLGELKEEISPNARGPKTVMYRAA